MKRETGSCRQPAVQWWAAVALAVGLMAFAAPSAHADCTVSAQSVAFGSYDPSDSQALDGAGTIAVNCSPSASYDIALSSGGGSFSQRRMSKAGDLLYYNLYTSAARSIVWGNGSGGTATVGGSGESTNHTVYGRIAAQQNVTAGSYGDTIVVTVTF